MSACLRSAVHVALTEPATASRRRFVQGLAMAGGVGAIGFRPRSARAQDMAQLRGTVFDLSIGETPVNITGKPRMAVTVGGTAPGPVLRWREGDTVTLNVANRLREPTSIHWHGIRAPADMDGVPGLSFRGIMPGETFTYRIPIKQTGTYWYHSHSGMQEQLGLYGAIVIEPRGGEAHAADREHVILLSDWTDEDPMTVVANLKMQGDYYNYGQRTVGDLAHELERDGLARTWRDRSMWARMRMTPTDILDVSGATYTYLVNGAAPRANWTALFQPGERVRLRVINASAMTIFDVRIPGLVMSVVQADGRDVHPVAVDQFRIGVAETYDVIVSPRAEQAYTLFAQAQDRSGYARATLAPRMGMAAAVPPMDPRPVRTMIDMGMGGMNAPPVPSGGAPAASMGGKTAMDAMSGMSGMDMGAKPAASEVGAATPSAPGVEPMKAAAELDPRNGLPVVDADHVAPGAMKGAVNVDNVAMDSSSRLGQAGGGLEHDGRRTLVYTDLRALRPGPDRREPTREIVFHLTGNMWRWTWGFDGKKFAEVGPVHLKLGERVRFILVNDTMMEHPIHLHGLYSEIENGQGEYRPLKHTVLVKPGERMSYRVSADTPGHWALHCHLLYHMETGMFRTVVVS
ncbi:MAG TPA: copper resistance system multicopper oxidase [Caulobacteraceae bacterium]|nr:copper resistance system multicopper oxidase [Caulobacteraceae bacterium]